MAAHETGRLWELARGRLSGADAEQVRAHVAGCAECAEQLAAAERAVQAMQGLTPPPRPAAQWSAIDEAILERARAQLQAGPLQRFADALSEFFTPRWTLAAAVVAVGMVAIVLWRPASPGGVEPVTPPPAFAQLPSTPAPSDSTAPRVDSDAVARVAQVITAVDSTSTADATLPEGTRVETRPHGEAVLRLPEGSAIDVRADSVATLASLGEDAVRLEVNRGEVVVAATHREARTFEVVAGDATVRVVGTRFAVARTSNGSIVRVTEGRVRVTTQKEETFVSGGEELTVTPAGMQKRPLSVDLTEELAPFVAKLEAVIQPMPNPDPARRSPGPAPQDTEAKAAPPAMNEAPIPEPRAEAAHPGNDAPPAQPSAPEAPGTGDPDEWALPPLGSTTADAGQAPKRTAKKPTTRDAGQPWINGAVGNVKKWLDVDWNAPFPPVGMSVVEYRVRQMERLADAGRCQHVLTRADAWDAQFVTDAGAPPDAELHRTVELTRARCLEKLGRLEEAKRVRARWP